MQLISPRPTPCSSRKGLTKQGDCSSCPSVPSTIFASCKVRPEISKGSAADKTLTRLHADVPLASAICDAVHIIVRALLLELSKGRKRCRCL